MKNSVRMYEASEYWFITARCFQARKLMTPADPLVREVCGGVLARAAAKYGVGVFAYAFLSNHLHLAIRGRGKLVASFLKYLMGNLSRKLAPLCAEPWRGCFWEGRRSVIPILDDAALLAQVRYIAAHGVKEGLVARATDWEGLHCAAQLIDAQPRTFRWFDWTARWKAKGGKQPHPAAANERYAQEWASEEKLELEVLPGWRELSEAERQASAQALVDGATDHLARERPLGMEKVKEQGLAVPAWRKRSREPECFAADASLRDAFGEALRSYVEAFHSAAILWLAGALSAPFPPGCFRPFLHNEVQIV